MRTVEPLTHAEIKTVPAPTGILPSVYTTKRLVLLALDTGLRASEIAGITLEQLNLQAGTVKVMGKSV